MNKTNNLNLTLFERTDKMKITEKDSFNDNMEIIDSTFTEVITDKESLTDHTLLAYEVGEEVELMTKEDCDALESGLDSQLTSKDAMIAQTKKDLERVRRSADALWKLNRGQVYDFQESVSTEPTLEVPIGAMSVDVLKIGGMSRKCKNLLNSTLQTTTSNGVTCTNNGDGTYTVNGTASGETKFPIGQVNNLNSDLRYMLVGCPKNGDKDTTYSLWSNVSGSKIDIGNGIDCPSISFSDKVCIVIKNGATVSNLVFKPMITDDLSATYDDFEPYTENLINSEVDKVVVRGNNLDYEVVIPESVTSKLPDYGKGLSTEVYNYIDLSTMKYHRNVTVSGLEVSQLPTPEVLDLLQVLNEEEIFQLRELEKMKVEPSGSIQFHYPDIDTYKMDVPNTVEYIVKLENVSEV